MGICEMSNAAPLTHPGGNKPKSDPFGTAPARARKNRKGLILLVVGVIVVGGGIAAWMILSKPELPPGFAGGNGRLEANQLYIAAKYPGRIKDVLFNEGDTVEAGQVVARMDTSALDAQLREAEAQIKAAQDSRNVALTQVAVKQADYDFARKQDVRSRDLVPRGAISQREAEIDNASMLSTKAQLAGSKAQAVQTLSAIAAAKATADRLRAEIADAVLVAPIRARVETRLAEPGEVLGAGGRVYSEARIVLDAAQQYPVRAYVSYVSPMAQFTPKTVETAEERHNLTFRVKLQIDKNRLRQFEPLVKFGLPGMGYVRYTSADWPEKLQPKANIPADLWKPTGSASGSK
jgi:HlyD family secretion protein